MRIIFMNDWVDSILYSNLLRIKFILLIGGLITIYIFYRINPLNKLK